MEYNNLHNIVISIEKTKKYKYNSGDIVHCVNKEICDLFNRNKFEIDKVDIIFTRDGYDDLYFFKLKDTNNQWYEGVEFIHLSEYRKNIIQKIRRYEIK